MPRLLIIAYVFPPLAGAAVMRPLVLAREARKHGWDAAVLTVGHDPKYPTDHTLKSPVRTARAYRYPFFLVINRFLRRLLPGKRILWSILDEFYDWVPSAVRTGRKLYRSWPFDAIVATSPPYSDLRVGARLARDLKVPCIADLRDPFTTNFVIDFVHPAVRRFWHDYYCSILRRFDRIVTVDRIISDEIPFHSEVIPNGYDEEEFSESPQRYPEFTIGYVGTMYAALDTRPLFEALRLLPESVRLSVRVLFVGAHSDLVANVAAKYGISNLATIPQVPRKEALSIMKKCHVLTIFGGTATEAVGSKLFEYARTGATVINVSRRDSGAWRFVEETGLAINVAVDDARRFAQIIEDTFRAGAYRVPKGIEKFSRQHSAASFFRLLDGLLSEKMATNSRRPDR
ncbi:MAG: hypothetical protein C4K49_00900 [Candidatus Thorarchaeota archaeon]|nr:MAG: hypothetical protein C4K49_00900 [Candidatus Thorarchaeota archaeon]